LRIASLLCKISLYSAGNVSYLARYRTQRWMTPIWA